MTHKRNYAGHEKAFTDSSQNFATSSVTKQQHGSSRCLVTSILGLQSVQV
jgi:hypothetical protein